MSPTLVFKTIKPARLNDAAMRRALVAAMKQAGRDIRADFQATTKYWSHKPKFEIVTDTTGGQLAVLVGTDDRIYRLVSAGTRPHLIKPVQAQALRFQAKYKPHTQPRVIGSGRGGASGPVVLRRAVKHPGTVAREFERIIQQKWQPRFKRAMEAAMRTAARVSGQQR